MLRTDTDIYIGKALFVGLLNDGKPHLTNELIAHMAQTTDFTKDDVEFICWVLLGESSIIRVNEDSIMLADNILYPASSAGTYINVAFTTTHSIDKEFWGH